MTLPIAPVKCGSCRACCKGGLVVIRPEHGDDPTLYQTREVQGLGHVLLHQENGDCIHLGAEGCRVYPNHPAMCRFFDCAAAFMMWGRKKRRQMMTFGAASKEVIAAGRERAREVADPNAYLMDRARALSAFLEPR